MATWPPHPAPPLTLIRPLSLLMRQRITSIKHITSASPAWSSSQPIPPHLWSVLDACHPQLQVLPLIRCVRQISNYDHPEPLTFIILLLVAACGYIGWQRPFLEGEEVTIIILVAACGHHWQRPFTEEKVTQLPPPAKRSDLTTALCLRNMKC